MFILEDGKESSIVQSWALPYLNIQEQCNAKDMLLVHSKICNNMSITERAWTNIIRENIEVELPEGVFISKLQFQLGYMTACIIAPIT